MGRPRLAIVIPAYREASSISAVVKEARNYGAVIVVDDCSPDNTASLATVAGAIVLTNATNLGYDGAINRGFEEAAARGYSHVVTMDADGEHAASTLCDFREALFDRACPLVLGYRPRKQRLAEVVMGYYIRARFGVRDILCGMKGYDLALWRKNGGFDHSDSIGTELALNALRRGVRFEQIAVTGIRRLDAPRFDRRFRANLRIFAALLRSIKP